MEAIHKGYYQNKKNEDDVVRAIWFPSFEDEVIIEAFTGLLKSWNVEKFLKKYTRTEKKFKPKLDRVKDGAGTSGQICEGSITKPLGRKK